MYFSIIIPVYNAQNHIIKCIQSIKAQTFTDFECILINDGSTDESEKTIYNEIAEDSRFILLNKQNGGVSSARNMGLKNAKGQFILFADSDDWVEPELLQEIKNNSEGHDIIQYDFYKVSKGKNGEKKKEIHIKSDINLILQGEGAVVWKRAFSKKVLENILFDETLAGGEDYLFCSNVFLKCPQFYYLDKCLYNYNIANNNSAMSQNSIKTFTDQLLATKKVENLLETYELKNQYGNNLNERYFWCLAEFNNWWLILRNKKGFTRKILLKMIKIILKRF